MSTHTLRSIADDVHKWMEGGVVGSNQNCWVVVDEESDGLDLALRLTQMRVGKQDVEVRYDTLPVLVGVNAVSGRCLWILSQPNHIPTVQVTMQRVVADMRERPASTEEKTKLSKIVEQAGGDPNKDLTGNPLQLAQQMQQQNFEPIAPHKILIDQEEPMWDTLAEFIDHSTDLTLTGRVKRRFGSRHELNQYEGDSDRKLERYSDEED